MIINIIPIIIIIIIISDNRNMQKKENFSWTVNNASSFLHTSLPLFYCNNLLLSKSETTYYLL